MGHISWFSATVHLDTELVGSYTYEWTNDMDALGNLYADNPATTSKWTFSGGPRKFYEGETRIN